MVVVGRIAWTAGKETPLNQNAIFTELPPGRHNVSAKRPSWRD